MTSISLKKLLLAGVVALVPFHSANAFFFIVPIPNLRKPPALNNLIDALEKSNQTKAVAYVSEDKTFGQKFFSWGHAVGVMTQLEANEKALAMCAANLLKAKQNTVGGQPLYDFGNKSCELYKFTNESIQLPYVEPVKTEAPAPAPVAVTAPVITDSPIAIKLKELEGLLQQNLITKEEFEIKRKEVLNKL